ncbi:hypothetical protein LDENG_00152650, partial [Lucifuga dentata]
MILRSMVYKLLMKVYCGCYSTPIRSIYDSFYADVCSEHVHQVWLHEINSFRRYTTFYSRC